MHGDPSPGGSTIRVVTWNLRGRDRPDLAEVAAVLTDIDADVVALQEVHRDQARHLARRLGMAAWWRCKHWPVVARPEGLAILSRRGVRERRALVLAARWRFWSHRRRIALAATVGTGPTGVRILDLHLGSGVAADERIRQWRRAERAVTSPRSVALGDWNAGATSPVLERARADGWRDAASVAGAPPDPTVRRGGAHCGPLSARIDHVYVGPAMSVLGVRTWTAAETSDHVPVSADLG